MQLPQAKNDNPAIKEFNRLLTSLPPAALQPENTDDIPQDEEIVGPFLGLNIPSIPDSPEYCMQLKRELLQLHVLLKKAGMPEEVEIKDASFTIGDTHIYTSDPARESYRLKAIKNWWNLLIKAFSFIINELDPEAREKAAEGLKRLSLKPSQEAISNFDDVFDGEPRGHSENAKQRVDRLRRGFGLEALECPFTDFLYQLNWYSEQLAVLRPQLKTKIGELQEKLSSLGGKQCVDRATSDALDNLSIKKSIEQIEFLNAVISAIVERNQMLVQAKEKGYPKSTLDLWLQKGDQIEDLRERATFFFEIKTSLKPQKPESEIKTAPKEARPKRVHLEAVNISDASTLDECTAELKRLCGLVPYESDVTQKIFAMEYPNHENLEREIQLKIATESSKQATLNAEQNSTKKSAINGEWLKLQSELRELRTQLASVRQDQLAVRKRQIEAVVAEIRYLERAETKGLDQAIIDTKLAEGRKKASLSIRTGFFDNQLAD